VTTGARRQLHARRAAAVRWGHAAEARATGRQMAEERIVDALRALRRQYGGPSPDGRKRMRLFVDGEPPPWI
jgi:hypothetical protein